MAPPLTASVFFGESTTAVADGVEDVHLLEAEYQHERAVIHVRSLAPTSKRFASGAPVSVLWGRPPGRSRWFLGYVNHTEPLHSSDRPDDPLLKVVCVGVTSPAKSQGYRTFRNVSPTAAVKALATEMRFDLTHIAPYASNSAVLHQSGKSDWEFMVECAKQAGYTLFSRGTALYCMDRGTLIERSASVSPVLAPTTKGGDVQHFVPARGASTPQGGDLAVRGAFAVNPRSGALLSTTVRDTGRPLFGSTPVVPVKTKAQTDIVFSDMADAYEQLNAAARADGLPIAATLVGKANPRCRVGKTVALAGFGPDGDGLWYVTAAEQTVGAAERSEMVLTLGRDTEMPAFNVRTPPVSSAPPARGARLLTGRWVAA